MANLPALYVEAWTAPRVSMRRILSLTLSERDRVIMVAITGVLFAIPLSLVIGAMEMPIGPDGVAISPPSTLSLAMLVVGGTLIGYYVTAALIKGIGGLFGGSADFTQCKTAAAWSQFVIGLANLVMLLLSFVMPTALDAILRLIFTVAAIYVSSAYIAEVHGFRSTVKVIAISFAALFAIMLLLLPMLPAQMPQ